MEMTSEQSEEELLFYMLSHVKSDIVKMSIKEKHICRLCLKATENEFDIDDIVKQMLEILLLKVDLDINRAPIICQDCMEVAKMCLYFKSTCINIEYAILSYTIDKIEAKHNIKVIYEQWVQIGTVFHENFKICRFCMTQYEGNNFVSLDTLRNEGVFEMLSQFMAEMDFNAIENPLICTSCKENIEGYFKFILNYLESEEKLKAYCKEMGTRSMSQVKLGNIPQFMFIDILEYPNKYSQACKIEQDHPEYVYPQTYIELMKQEELDNRDEEMTLDPQSSISEIKMHKCSLCPYKAKLRGCLNRHLLTHKDVSEIKMFKCPMCPYQARQRAHLNRHMLVHKDVSEIEMFKCSICPYEAKQRRSLNSHMLAHKDDSEIDMFKCSMCPYEAKIKLNFNRHMLVHKDVSEINMFKCSLCPYQAKRRQNLNNHMLGHKDISEINWYKCSLCSFKGKHKHQLTAHMLIHKDISKRRVFKCPLCAFESNYKSSITSHVLVHKNVSEINMYKCSLCASEFKQKGTLKSHMLVHKDVSEIKMHKCSLCAFESKYKKSLKTHTIKVHEKAPVKRKVKGKWFTKFEIA